MMSFLGQMRAQSVGLSRDDTWDFLSSNHFKSASITASLSTQIKSHGLRRVSGNIFVCPSTQDFWSVKNGKIIRLIGMEIDSGDSITGAPADDPSGFISGLMGELTL